MLLFPFICLQAYASNFVGADSVKVDVADEYVKEYETVLVLRDSLKFLDDLEQDVAAENNRLQKSAQEYSTLLKQRKQQLAKVEASILSSGLEDILERQAVLQSKINEAEYERSRLLQEISLLNQEIGQLQGHKDDLDQIKDEKSQQLLEKYGAYLELPFSSMSIDGLQEILRECSGYVLDPRIEALVKRTDVILNCKRIYDHGNLLCLSSFSKGEVQEALADLSDISGVNAEQNAEIEKLMTQLGKFEEGVLLFAEFIKRLNEIRDPTTRYSPSDFKDDLPYILEGIEEKIEQTIRVVPYLDREFTKYMEILKTDPMQRPAIEQEMLGL